MIRTFIEVPLFTKRCNDDDLLALQIMLLKDEVTYEYTV